MDNTCMNLFNSDLWKPQLHNEYHTNIWQFSPQLSCGNMWQIWIWLNRPKLFFCKIKFMKKKKKRQLHQPRSLGATARSYRRQDGADAATRFEKFLPARASLRPPISLKFTTEKHGGMVRLAPKRQTRTYSRFCTIIPERFAARRR